MLDINNWKGTWKTRNGTVVEISASNAFDDGIMVGKLVKHNLVTVWRTKDGNHIADENLDLITRKRDEDTFTDFPD